MKATKRFESTAFMGWVAAAALLGVLAGGGFKQATDKLGVVDIAKVIEDSEFGKANQAEFTRMKQSRETLLEFIDTNRVLTNEQAQRLRDLSVKPNATDAEKAEIERIKADVVASAKRAQEMQTKQTLTPEERTLLQEYAQRGQNMDQVAQRWYRDFTTEMQDWADKQKLASVQKARQAIEQVAKAQGFSVVFEVGIAPYGANDLTSAATQALNAQK